MVCLSKKQKQKKKNQKCLSAKTSFPNSPSLLSLCMQREGKIRHVSKENKEEDGERETERSTRGKRALRDFPIPKNPKFHVLSCPGR